MDVMELWSYGVMDGLTDRCTKNHEIIIGGHIEAVLNSI